MKSPGNRIANPWASGKRIDTIAIWAILIRDLLYEESLSDEKHRLSALQCALALISARLNAATDLGVSHRIESGA